MITSTLGDNMNIVGFHFTKINGEKKNANFQKFGIKYGLNITRVEEAKLGITDKKSKSLKIFFTYSCMYEPDHGQIDLDGDFIFVEENKAADAVLKHWNEKKRPSKELLEKVTNFCIQRCSLQALFIAKELGLPSPIPLPKVTIQ